MYKEATDDEKIKYYDVTSLYPFINKTGKEPLGHPAIITENFDPAENYDGLMKCKILAPRDLYIPVLSCKISRKLMFGLCRTCTEENCVDLCNHDEEERAFIGTWVTDEIKKAVEISKRFMKYGISIRSHDMILLLSKVVFSRIM